MPSPPTEVELKFLIAPEAVDDLFDHQLPRGEVTTAELRSVYYDTPGLDLRNAGFSLRVRQTGAHFVRTVKSLAAGGPRRCEWKFSVMNEAVDRAALAKTPAGALLHDDIGSLAPIFITIVERCSQVIKFENARIEVSFDRGELSSGDASEPIAELELELKAGKISSLFSLARQLVLSAPLHLSFESKAERGLRLRQGASASPRIAEPIALCADMPSMKAFQTIARACLAQATANADLLRRIRRPEAIHQLRIGLRRLRTGTAIFKAMLADDEREVIESEMKWLAGELDSARDIEVFGRTTFLSAAKAGETAGLADLGQHQRGKKLIVPDNITLLSLPPYSPELNPMENVWDYLRQNKLCALVWPTYDDILDACQGAWRFLINDPNRIRSLGSREWACVTL